MTMSGCPVTSVEVLEATVSELLRLYIVSRAEEEEEEEEEGEEGGRPLDARLMEVHTRL